MSIGVIVNVIIAISMALLPLYIRVVQFDFSRTSKDNLAVVIMSLVAILIPQRRKISNYARFVVVYMVLILAFNQYFVASINVMFQTFYLLIGIVFAVKFYEGFDMDSRHIIKHGLIVGALIQIASSLLDMAGINLYGYVIESITNSKQIAMNVPDFGGTFAHSNLLGSYLALASMLALPNIFLFSIIFIGLLMTKSAMAIAAGIAGLIYYFNYKKGIINPVLLYIGAIIAMICVYFIGAFGLDSDRFSTWNKIFLDVDLHHFLIGKGAGWFPDAMYTNGAEKMQQEHNEFISFFNIFGIIGVGLVTPFLKNISKQRDASFAALCFCGFVSCFGHFNFHVSTIALTLIVSACISIGGNDGLNLER